MSPIRHQENCRRILSSIGISECISVQVLNKQHTNRVINYVYTQKVPFEQRYILRQI